MPKPQTKKQNDKRLYIDSSLTKVKALGAGQFEGIVATSAVDRHGETLDVKGLDVTTYMSTNPIVLFGHDYWEAESVIGKALSLTKTKSGELLSRFELFTAENPKAALVAKLIKKGVLALSIGFIPQEIEGDTYTQSEMVEYSVVPVPANAEAAITARSFGLTKKEIDILSSVMKKEAKPVLEEVEIKGAVADELQEDADMEAKWNNLDTVCDIWWAFLDVYYDQNTPVSDFNTLLKEVVGLFTQVLAGTYVAPADGDGDDGEDADEEYPVTYALRNVNKEQAKAFVQKYLESKTEEPVTDADDDNSTTKAIDGDQDISWVQQFAQDFEMITEKMMDMKSTLNSAAAQTAAGGDEGDLQSEEDQATGNDSGGMKPTNAVRDVEDKVETKEVESEEDAEDEVEEEVEEAATTKKIDISNLNADTIKQLAKDLIQMAVELEEDAEKLASSTTKGANSPTAHKRKYVMKQARKKVVRVDKLVELTLAQLPH